MVTDCLLKVICMVQCVREFSVTITKNPRQPFLKGERFTLDHSFGDIKFMVDWFVALGLG